MVEAVEIAFINGQFIEFIRIIIRIQWQEKKPRKKKKRKGLLMSMKYNDFRVEYLSIVTGQMVMVISQEGNCRFKIPLHLVAATTKTTTTFLP